jgi:4a-hydroxytetrahydrobiopterin dehydratase
MGELKRVKLTDSEIAERLSGLAGWTVQNGKLEKSYAFDSYLQGPAFASAVGSLAEEMDHHPDILITWRKVTVSVETHSVGGISPLDFELARRIDELVR